jgi:hypothetical protein
MVSGIRNPITRRKCVFIFTPQLLCSWTECSRYPLNSWSIGPRSGLDALAKIISLPLSRIEPKALRTTALLLAASFLLVAYLAYSWILKFETVHSKCPQPDYTATYPRRFNSL